MILQTDKLNTLKELILGTPRKIALLCHTNPDGDTIGAALAWRAYLEQLGHTACCIAPNPYPNFLEWMSDIAQISVFREDDDGAITRFIAEADIIFSMDFNQIKRLDRLTEVVQANTTAVRVLIDHHLHPPLEEYTLCFSDIKACSTSYIVYQLIIALADEKAITRSMAESLYVGIMTDTGNFAYSFLDPDLFRAVAVLIERGSINVPYIYSAVYDNFSEERMRLLGYMLNDKMKLLWEYGTAYIGLNKEEMLRFNFKHGDSEGFVNYPLSIRGINLSAMFIETHHDIRVSLRSRGDVDVNVFARRYFNGGGHRNAAGGRSFVSMEETIRHFERSVFEYFDKRPLHATDDSKVNNDTTSQV